MLQKDSSYACQSRVDEVKISLSGSDTASKVDYTIFWRGRESMGEPQFVNKIINLMLEDTVPGKTKSLKRENLNANIVE